MAANTLNNENEIKSINTRMTQNMDMTAMAKIFFSNSIINFKKWY